MRADGLSRWLLAALALLLVGAGLWAVGGPVTARAERRDEVRLADLRSIRDTLDCLATAGEPPPETLDAIDVGATACMAPARVMDPYGGTPYRYERLSEGTVRLCAGFERPDLVLPLDYYGRPFDPESGCHVVGFPAAPG